MVTSSTESKTCEGRFLIAFSVADNDNGAEQSKLPETIHFKFNIVHSEEINDVSLSESTNRDADLPSSFAETLVIIVVGVPYDFIYVHITLIMSYEHYKAKTSKSIILPF